MKWTKENRTNELRVVKYRVWAGPGHHDFKVEQKLQQKWEIIKGGEGNGVSYDDEWRDVPTYSWENRDV